MQQNNKIKKQQIIGMLVSIAIVIIMYFMPAPADLGVAGWRTISILLVFLILLVTEAFPAGVICIITLILMPVLGAVPSIGDGFTGFANPVTFFILASFGISAAIAKMPIAHRILLVIIRLLKGSTRGIIFGIMVCTALFSSMVSNIPTTAIFMGIALGFLDIFEDEDEKKRTGKALMIAIPVSAMVGGVMTPAGSSLNLLVIGMLEQMTGITVSFVQWMVFGIPLAIVILPAAWLIITKVYHPADMDPDRLKAYVNTLNTHDKMDIKEKFVILVTLIMLVCWIASSWFPVFNVTMVALCGLFCLFLPKIGALTWDEFVKSVSWQVFFLVGTVLTLGTAISANGIGNWLVASFMPEQMSITGPILIAICGFIGFAMLIVVPVAPAFIAVLAPAMISVAANCGYSPAILMIILGICAGNAYLLPLDTVPMITYSKGFYKMSEMPKSTALIQVILVVLMAVWFPLAGSIVGFI
ncbi:SLC13 family permease [Eubacterium callanderi]|uniref:SLC13 family permease n=1 Tax=Eubacterium callanderi TaxID=53442 RepID=UPI00399BA946